MGASWRAFRGPNGMAAVGIGAAVPPTPWRTTPSFERQRSQPQLRGCWAWMKNKNAPVAVHDASVAGQTRLIRLVVELTSGCRASVTSRAR